MANIDEAERLLCQRYNIQALDGELKGAVEQARAGNLHALRGAVAARELYRWRDPINAALSEPSPEPEAEAADGLDGLTIAELRAVAEERGIDLGSARLKAEIVDAIEAADGTEPEADEEEEPEGLADA